MSRFLYSSLLYLLLPFILLRLFWRSRFNTGYRQRIAERFARFEAPSYKTSPIWVHAVSLGESIVAIPLIRRLQQAYPDTPIVVTTTTPTGSYQIQKTFDHPNILHYYAPYDFPDVVARFLKKVHPCLLVLMETELWPNLMHHCHAKNIPVLIANARLSMKSAVGYSYIAPLVKPMMRKTHTVLAQTKEDAERFEALGLASDKVMIAGNMKFDQKPPASIFESAELLRRQWGNSRPIWVAASTHEGEDEKILSVFRRVLKKHPHTLLVLVPRHPERFEKVTQLCRQEGFLIARRSQALSFTRETQIFIGDSIGELMLFYAASDIAFVGGSLVPAGGHNPLEPVMLGLPTVMGPHDFNFLEIRERLAEAGVLVTAEDTHTLTAVILNWLNDLSVRTHIAQAGQKVLEENRGAIQKHLETIDAILKTESEPSVEQS